MTAPQRTPFHMAASRFSNSPPPRSDFEESLISESAARRTMDALITNVINAGYTFEQAQSMANAFQEYLLRKPGYEDRASNYLLAAGYDKAQTQKLIQDIQEAIGTASETEGKSSYSFSR